MIEENQQSTKTSVPIITYFILAINILIFILTELAGGSTNRDVLIEFGAKDNLLIWSGEYWRLLTPIFLHIGISHLIFNSWALYVFGPTVEMMFGKIKFIIIYLIAGLTGSILSVIMTPSLSAGASGAIFGLMGAMFYFSYHFRHIINRNFVINLLLMLGINIFFGFTTPGIDNYAHLGGLTGGLLTSAVLGTRNEQTLNKIRIFSGVILVSIIILLGVYSVTPDQSSVEWNFTQGNTAFKSNNYTLAESYYLKVLSKEPDSEETHYNLGLTYLQQGKTTLTLKEMKEVLKLAPTNQNAAAIIERIKK